MPKPKPWTPSPEVKKAARRAVRAKRPAKVITLIVPPIEAPAPIEEVLSQATPIEVAPEAEPEIHIALYADNAPLEPEAVVVVVAGRKSLFKRFGGWWRL